MSAADQDSGLDIVIRPMPDGLPTVSGNSFTPAPMAEPQGISDDLDRQASQQGIMLNGEVLACPCPD